MANSLNGYKVAILAVDGFEQAKLVEPQRALKEAGVQVDVVSQKPGQIQGFNHVDKADKVNVDVTFDAANATDYDAMVLPGDVVNGDAIRLDAKAQSFVKDANQAKKPIAVMPRWLAADLGGHRRGPHDDELAEPAGRCAQRGRHVGRSGSADRRQSDFEPQAGRYSRVQSGDHRCARQGARRLNARIRVTSIRYNKKRSHAHADNLL